MLRRRTALSLSVSLPLPLPLPPGVGETLAKIRADASIAPLLAQSWTVTPDNKTWAFKLRPGVRFHNGEPFTAASVKFSFERAAAADRPTRDKAVFANIANISATDDGTVVITLKNTHPHLPFQIGQATAVIVEPKRAASNGTQPVGTGPFRLHSWANGSAHLYQSTWITVANVRLKDVRLKGVRLKGVWLDMPIFANDLSLLRWA